MKEKKLTMRQQQAIKTKNKISKVAVELMNKNGFNNTTIEEISSKAGVSVGAFYHYYKSKEDVFLDIYKEADDYFRDEVAEQLTSESALENIVIFFKYYAIFNNERGIENTSQLYNTKNKLFIAKDRYMKTLLQEVIEKGQEKGEIRTDMSPEEVVDCLFVLVRGVVYDWCIHEGDYDLEEAMDKHVERFVVTLKK
jgi:AcrR family transcriptional regulator